MTRTSFVDSLATLRPKDGTVVPLVRELVRFYCSALIVMDIKRTSIGIFISEDDTYQNANTAKISEWFVVYGLPKVGDERLFYHFWCCYHQWLIN